MAWDVKHSMTRRISQTSHCQLEKREKPFAGKKEGKTRFEGLCSIDVNAYISVWRSTREFSKDSTAVENLREQTGREYSGSWKLIFVVSSSPDRRNRIADKFARTRGTRSNAIADKFIFPIDRRIQAANNKS